MTISKKLLEALLDKNIKPKIANPLHRELVEQIATDILEKAPTKTLTKTQKLKQALIDKNLLKNKQLQERMLNYSEAAKNVNLDKESFRSLIYNDYDNDILQKITEKQNYLDTKRYNKLKGRLNAIDISIDRKEHAPKTRVFTEEEKPRYFNWHQQHRSNAKIPTREDIYWRDYDEAYRQANMSKISSRNFKEADIKLNNKEFKELQDRVSRYNQHFGTNVRTTPDKNGKWDDRFIRAVRLAEQKKYEQRYAKKQIKQETDAFAGVDNIYDGTTSETYKEEFNDYIKQFYDEEI